MPAAPPVRSVAVRVLTPIGWMQGVFVLPRMHAFVDFVEHAGPFLRIHDVRLPGRKDAVRTFVMQRNAVLLVVPEDAEHLEKAEMTASAKVAHRVSCLMEHGVVHGKLVIVADVAIGDFLLHHSGFVVLRDCVIQLRDASKPSGRIPWLVVNAAHVIGVSEEPAMTRGRASR